MPLLASASARGAEAMASTTWTQWLQPLMIIAIMIIAIIDTTATIAHPQGGRAAGAAKAARVFSLLCSSAFCGDTQPQVSLLWRYTAAGAAKRPLGAAVSAAGGRRPDSGFVSGFRLMNHESLSSDSGVKERDSRIESMIRRPESAVERA